jgi:carboxyl-terminal processing protease
VKTRVNEFALKEADLKKHLEEELEKVDDKKDASKTKKEDEKTSKLVITDEMLIKDMQLKTASDILKALIITKGK